MTHKHDLPDLDTETGLPRKAGWKVAFWALGVLQAIALACLVRVINTQDKQADDIADVRVRVARIEGLLKLTASGQSSIATVYGPPIPMP